MGDATEKRERDELEQAVIDPELDDQSSRSEKKSSGFFVELLFIVIGGYLVVLGGYHVNLFLQFGQTSADLWDSLALVAAGVLVIWASLAGLGLLPSLDMLREIWAEWFEEKVDLSDVEVPPVDDLIE